MDSLIVLILIVTLFSSSEGVGSSASLTVEGGISLVGPHCPGTARLFCEGEDLTALRWYFNGNIDNDIETFLPGDAARTVTTLPHPAFISVELVSANRTSNQVLGNFLSFFTVDLFQLEQENVTEINCGAGGVFATVSVNFTVLQQSVPDAPTITEVIATYQSGVLAVVQVSWTKVPVICPSNESFLVYQVNLTGSASIEVINESCGDVFCQTEFNMTSSTNVSEYELTLLARNNIGSSTSILYPNTIGRQRQLSSLTPGLCQPVGQCLSYKDFDNEATCTVHYTDDSTYTNLLNVTTTSLNTTFGLPRLAPESVFYFQFSFATSGSLQVIEQVEYLTGPYPPRLTPVGILMVVIAVLFEILSVAYLIIVPFLLKKRWKQVTVIPVIILLLITLIVVAVLIAIGVTVGSQDDTCDQMWQSTRDALLIITLVFFVLGIATIIIVSSLLVCVSRTCEHKMNSPSLDESQRSDYITMRTPSSFVDGVTSDPVSHPLQSENEGDWHSDIKECTFQAVSMKGEAAVHQQYSSVLSTTQVSKKETKRTKITSRSKSAQNEVQMMTMKTNENYVFSHQANYEEVDMVPTDATTGELSMDCRGYEHLQPVPNVETPHYASLHDKDEPREKPISFSTREHSMQSKVSNKQEMPSDKSMMYETLDHNDGQKLASLSIKLPTENYDQIEKPLRELKGARPYEQLRAGEKSKPVPNMEDPNYEHLGRRTSKEPSATKGSNSSLFPEDDHNIPEANCDEHPKKEGRAACSIQ